MKTPKYKAPKTQEVVPLPDMSGAATMQARFDALKQALGRRGRSSTIMTYSKPKAGQGMSGRLSDVTGGREAPQIMRGG